MDKINLLLAAGGTGGHLFPAISVLDSFLPIAPNIRILVFSIGISSKIEYRMAIQRNWQFFEIPMKGFPGVSWKLFPFIFNTLRSVNICRNIIQENSIDFTIATGAYISYPAGIASKLQKKPLFLIETNIYPGKSNRLLSTKADIIFLGYEKTKEWLPKNAWNKCLVVGVPVRPEILVRKSKEEACKKFGLDPNKKTLLVFGGSLGAQSINLVMQSIYPDLLAEDIQILWQTGSNFHFKSQLTNSLKVFDFIDDMSSAYYCADVVVSRAGASSIAELSATAKPAILIPYPYATNRHQEINSSQLEKNSAVMVLTDDELPFKLKYTINSLIFNEERLQNLSQNISKYSNSKASEIIAREILKYMNY